MGGIGEFYIWIWWVLGMPLMFTPDGNGTHYRDSTMRQGGVTADARKTSSDYGEWTGEGVRTSVQQGVNFDSGSKRSVQKVCLITF